MVKKNPFKIDIVVIMFLILSLVSGIFLLSSNNKIGNLKFKNEKVKYKYSELVKYIGEPNIKEFDKDNFVHSLTWQSPLDKYNGTGKYGGLDYIKISGYITRKYHPIPADCYLIVGRYMNVPDHLLGPLKYASETINIEQLFVPKNYNQVYEETGQKEVSLVTGSCASVSISSVTVKFVEDMIEKYKFSLEINPLDLYQEFRNEYDKRVLNYLCGGGIKPKIDWFDAEMFGEVEVWTDGNFPQCHNTPGISSNK